MESSTPQGQSPQKQRATTRRQALRLLGGVAAAAPALRPLSALANSEPGDLVSLFGIGGQSQIEPAPPAVSTQVYPPVPAPAPWQPPYPYEPAIPENPVLLPILMYHRATLPTVFESQLVGMLTAGYRPLSLHSAVKGLLGEEELPHMPIVLTFDDGWEVQYDAVFPVLKQYKIPATFFVMPGFHELQEGYMNWDQIIEIADFGMEVESHTINHADLPLLARRDWGAVLAEVVISKQILEERLERTLRYFDYPLGRHNEEIVQLVQDVGYEAAVIIGPGVHQSAETPYALRRIRVEAWDLWSQVEHKLSWYGAGPDDFVIEDATDETEETAEEETESTQEE
jgi:peptidoglycan/xylan/chitin deacetylase (PgdA/CDA1 family)